MAAYPWREGLTRFNDVTTNFNAKQVGTLLFLSPGQLVGIKGRPEADAPEIKGLVFHSDLLHGTPLARMMKDYSFFSYDANEALHMSDREKRIILGCLDEIRAELANNIDRHTKQILHNDRRRG